MAQSWKERKKINEISKFVPHFPDVTTFVFTETDLAMFLMALLQGDFMSKHIEKFIYVRHIFILM